MGIFVSWDPMNRHVLVQVPSCPVPYRYTPEAARTAAVALHVEIEHVVEHPSVLVKSLSTQEPGLITWHETPLTVAHAKELAERLEVCAEGPEAYARRFGSATPDALEAAWQKTRRWSLDSAHVGGDRPITQEERARLRAAMPPPFAIGVDVWGDRPIPKSITAMSEPKPIDTLNRFGVASRIDGEVVLLRPPTTLTREEALTFIAWIATLLELEPEAIEAHRRAVEKT